MALQGLGRLNPLLPLAARSFASSSHAADAAKTQVSSAAKAGELAEGLTIDKVEGKHGAISFLKEATGATSAVGALKDYARAILDGNLGEVAIYGSGATLVGSDDAGNKYYERKDAYMVRARMVLYSTFNQGKLQGYEPSTVQADGWYSWLHHTTDTPPTQRAVQLPIFSKPRQLSWNQFPKTAPGRYFPKGSWYAGEDRRNWGKVAAWKPPGAKA